MTRKLHFPINDPESIKMFVPHRDPILLVDGVIEYTPTSLSSTYSITSTGMFIENEQFSEAGLIEHMAQSVALHAGIKGYLKGDKIREGFIAEIKKATIKKLPKSFEKLETSITILFEALDMSKVSIETYTSNQLIAQTEMTTVLKSDKNE